MSAWQPIETAPLTEGPDMLVYRGEIGTDYPWPAEGDAGSASAWLPGTTHWMPWPESGWLTMDSAQKDGADVLLKSDNPDEPYGYGRWEDHSKLDPVIFGSDPNWQWSKTCDGELIAWQPMPAPPLGSAA